LDPVNVEMIKGLIRELQAEGKTIVLSLHQMNLVEALCDRILLINRGRAVLYGPLAEIKRQYAPHTVRLRTPAELESLPGVTRINKRDHTFTLTLDGIDAQALLRTLVEQGIPVETFEVATAPLEEIFVAVVQGRGLTQPAGTPPAAPAPADDSIPGWAQR
jgi:ABC-2 type transport system ATP-binding protein